MALMLRTCLSIFFILSASFFVPNLLAFDLAKNGKASATVVIHSDAGIAVKHNAKIFVKYLSAITGADFEISDGVVPASGNVILLGAPYPSKRFEEISIRLTQPNLLVVTGEGTRGPVYAMYRLLEYFGCYFWAPGNETVPSKKDLSLPQNFKLVDAPVFQFRQPLGASTYSRDWRSKNYINGDMNMLHSESTPEMGGPYEMAMSRQWLYGIPCDDKAKYAMESNPEWFAWRSGAKARTHLGLCFTNTKLLDVVVEKIKADQAKRPGPRYYSCSYHDNDKYCQCKTCVKLIRKEGSPSALLVYAANYIGKAIAKDCPEAKIICLAYWISLHPPKRLKTEPNVHIAVANPRDYTKRPSDNAEYWNAIRSWSKITGGNIFIYDYNCNFTSMLTPTPIIDAMGPAFRDYMKADAKGIYQQMSMHRLGDFIDLRCWLFARLAWNPEQDEWKLIDQWCDGACGAGSPFIKEWLRYSKRCIRGQAWHSYQRNTLRFFTGKDILTGYELFQKAIKATKNDPKANAMVRKCYTSVLILMINHYNIDVVKRSKNMNITLPTREELLKTFEDSLVEFKVHDWMECAEGLKNDRFIEFMRKEKWLKPEWR